MLLLILPRYPNIMNFSPALVMVALSLYLSLNMAIILLSAGCHTCDATQTVEITMPIKRFNILISIIKDKLSNASSLGGNRDEPKRDDHKYLLTSLYEKMNPKVYTV